jgi:glycosyltransferase involved in cell wall biosynthesis
MRLGFVSGRLAMSNGAVFTDAGVGRLIDTLRDRVDAITAALSIVDPMPLLDHELKLDEGSFVPLPAMPSFKAGMFRHAECARVIRAVEDRSDVVVVQLPFPSPSSLARPRRPRVYHICADVRSIVRASTQYRGANRVAAVGAAFAVEAFYRHLCRAPHARVITNGRDLARLFAPDRARPIVSSSLHEREIGSVARTRPPDAPFRILFVGHLRPEKGFDVLVEAFERVRARIPNAELQVVGPAPKHQKFVAEFLAERSSKLVEAGAVELLGPKDFGLELFRCFADADVLALPSVSEGTPRVLVEARAFGCPVVASNVGGIPTSIHDGVDGLLIPPRDPVALSRALLDVALDAEIKKRLIAGGFERARRSTVEVFADAILAEAKAALAS